MAHNLMDSATYLSNLLAKGFSRSLLSKASELGFSPGQFPVLIELWNGDGLTQREILDRLDIEQVLVGVAAFSADEVRSWLPRIVGADDPRVERFRALWATLLEP